jgi:hypothetical protein
MSKEEKKIQHPISLGDRILGGVLGSFGLPLALLLGSFKALFLK